MGFSFANNFFEHFCLTLGVLIMEDPLYKAIPTVWFGCIMQYGNEDMKSYIIKWSLELKQQKSFKHSTWIKS